ncbi:MAG TPA: DUF6077 domain-containing protein [Rubrobacteraceae bacterium]|nr:DUF6077 domain-containing protein [Rubrobacteraceae bacterium]
MKAGGEPGVGDRLDAAFALTGVAALLFVGPLRSLFEDFPVVLFLSALFLFFMPGMLICRCYLADHFTGAASVPVAFVISAAIFGLLAVPMLILHSTLAVYLALAGAVVVVSLVAAGLRSRPRAPFRRTTEGRAESGVDALWVPFLIMCAALAYVAWTAVPEMYDDIWIYLSNVRDFTSTDRLALYEPYLGRETGISRVRINGWLLEQAALVELSGIDPIEFALRYLAPTLVVVALLAFYALARTLFERETAALFAASVYALFLLVNLSDSLLTFGGEFVGRMAEDKFAARYIFFPVALAVAVAFARTGRARHLWLFALICWAMMAVHPVGLAITGLAMAGFAVLYVAVNWRERAAWVRVSGLGIAGLSAIAIPAALAYLLTGEPLTSVLKEADINSGDPDVLANMVFVRPERQRILELGPDSYIMHPSLLVDPVVLGSLLLGVPFLVRRLKESLAAQMLLGVLLLVTVVCYVPQVATFVGDNVVVPGQLWRLAWPLPLAAILTVGWMAWETTRRAGDVLRRLRVPATGLLPAVLVVAVGTVIAPTALVGIEMVDRTEEVAQSPHSCFDPVFGWLRSNVDEPSVVLAPDAENTCVPAYSAQTNVLSVRGSLVLGPLPKLEERVAGEIEVPQGALDVRRFFSGPTPRESGEILRRYGVDYILLRKGSARNAELAETPGVTAVETPSERYALYEIDHRKIS